MNRLQICVLDDNRDDLALIERALKRSHLNPETFSCTSRTELFNFLESTKIEPQMLFCDYRMPDCDGLDVAKEFRERGYEGSFVLISGLGREKIEEIRKKAIRSEVSNNLLGKSVPLDDTFMQDTLNRVIDPVDYFVDKNFLLDTHFFQNTLDKLIAQELFVRPQKIGIVGLGKVGWQILTSCYDQVVRGVPCISEAHVYSKFLTKPEHKAHRDSLPDLLGSLNSNTRLFTHERLEDLIKEHPDLLVISTGSHNIKTQDFSSREEVERMLTVKAAYKIDHVYKIMRDENYNGVIIVLSNRTGTHLLRGIEWNPEWKNSLVSVSEDPGRLISALCQQLGNKIKGIRNKFPSPERMRNVYCFGDHGYEFPFLRDFCIHNINNSRNLADIDKIYQNPLEMLELEKKVAACSRPLGINSQKASAIWHFPSYGLERYVSDFVRSIATLRYRSMSRWKSPFSVQIFSSGEEMAKAFEGYEEVLPNPEQYDSFFSRPASFDHRDKTRVLVGEKDMNLDQLDLYWLKELQQQSIDQRDILREAYPHQPPRINSFRKQGASNQSFYDPKGAIKQVQ